MPFWSRKSSTTNTETTNNYADNRQVFDLGGGVLGDGNTQDNSQSYSYGYDASQTWADNSNRSNNWQSSIGGDDRSNRSTNYTTTDGGAITAIERMGMAQTEAAKAIGLRAFDSNDRTTKTAVDFATKAQENALASVDNTTARALALVEKNSAQSFDSSARALGMQMQGWGKLAGLAGDVVQAATKQTAQASEQARAAFNTAADQTTGNRTLILAGLAAVAIVGLMAFGKR